MASYSLCIGAVAKKNVSLVAAGECGAIGRAEGGHCETNALPDVSDFAPEEPLKPLSICYDAPHRNGRPLSTLFISLKTLHPTEHRPAKGIKKDPAKSRVKNRD
jgi:hypothetical protein